MRTQLKRRAKLGLGAAAVAAVAAGLPLAQSASALPPGTPPALELDFIPSGVKTSDTTFQFNLPVGEACPGDSASDGYRVNTYVTPASNDPAAITYSGLGVPSGPAFTAALRSPGGSPVSGLTVSAVDGFITLPATGFRFHTQALPAGDYNVGIACVLNQSGTINTMKYYNATMTVAPSAGAGPQNFIWGDPAVPAAPVLTGSTYNSGTATATVNFTHAASLPSTTGYTATLTPVGSEPAISPIPVAAGATSFQVPGIDLGESYTVTLLATNGEGDSSASNELTLAGTDLFPGPVVTAPNTFEGNDVTVTWTPPATGPSPVSYDVAVTPGGPSFTGVTGTSQVIPAGLALGDYTATVTPNYAAGSGATGTPGSDTFSITANTLVLQEITVNRPAGALILTQRCGVYGPLDPFVAVDAFPGYPRDLPLEDASLDQVGTAPDIDLGPGYTADPEFDSYPQPSPVTYPTECGLDMDTASLVTSGALAGQFYAADGRLNQVTVVDTRDTDTGWIARGDIEDTFSNGADTFSGDYLGWTPHVTDDSDPVGGSTYDQVVTEGNQILPGTGTTGTGTGLTSNPILAETAGNAGLGIATLDARMALLIPASADAGDYSGTLSLTVLPRVP